MIRAVVVGTVFVVAGCTRDNPAYDPQSGSGSSRGDEPPTTSAGPTSDPDATSLDPDTRGTAASTGRITDSTDSADTSEPVTTGPPSTSTMGESDTAPMPTCGNGVHEPPSEQCDDDNAIPEDGCSDCQLDDPKACGNGMLGPGEQCDDLNQAENDGCGPTCQLEHPELCGVGNGIDPGEECDDGNNLPGDGCGPTCQSER